MEDYNKQQEILFATDTSFVRQELYQNNLFTSNPDSNSSADRFEEACWNGILGQWLPGVKQNPDDKKLLLWKVFVANAFVSVELSEAPAEIRSHHSLNPYHFLSTLNNN
jgi:hypothetical protein